VEFTDIVTTPRRPRDGHQNDEARKERLVKNELAFRDYNDRRVAVEEGESGLAPWVCECGDGSCIAVLEATVDEFQSAHAAPDRFMVKPRHIFADVERVLETYDRYWVVEKHPGELRRAEVAGT
jgi:hypothetical protein